MVLSTHHIGIAVEDLEASIETYLRLFGAELEHRGRLDDQGVDAASLHAGTGRIELLAPLGPDTPVGRFLAGRGPGLHHIAFQVADVSVELERLRQAGTRLIDESPRSGLFGLQVAFVHPEATGGVLAEFVSDDRS